MEKELWNVTEADITWTKPTVKFPTFQYYLDLSKNIAEYIQTMEVNEETVKDAKKELAKARKLSAELNRRRIDIKKDILSGYSTFEDQIKMLTSTIDEADAVLGQKIRILDEQEREQKKETLHEIWNKRVQQYQTPAISEETFEKWLKPQHLNKSTSMKSIESDMTEWLERVQKDWETLQPMGREYLVEYLQNYDLAETINIINRRKSIEQTVRESQQAEEIDPEEEAAIFIIKGSTNITLTELLLQNNKIPFTKTRKGDY